MSQGAAGKGTEQGFVAEGRNDEAGAGFSRMTQDRVGGLRAIVKDDRAEAVPWSAGDFRCGPDVSRPNRKDRGRGLSWAGRPGMQGRVQAFRESVHHDDSAVEGAGRGDFGTAFVHGEDRARRSGEEGASCGSEASGRAAADAEDQQRGWMLSGELAQSGGWFAGADEGSGVFDAGKAEFAADLAQGPPGRIVGRGEGDLPGGSGFGEGIFG